MPVDWKAIRAEFPALRTWTYLNTATLGLIPTRVRNAVNAHFARRDALACTDFLDWWDDMDRVRALAARLVKCAPDDIAFIPNASTGLALAASAIEWRDGDEVLTIEDEFPNQFYFASGIAARVNLISVPPDRIFDAISARTRMVAISSVNYQNGRRAPYEDLGPLLRKRGIFFYLDGTQSAGVLTIDLQRVQPDVFAVHAYKWLISPPGAGFAYVDSSLRKRLRPRVIGWRSDRDWRLMENLRHEPPRFPESAEKYEGGMLPFGALYGMGAALELVLEIGPENIERRVLSLARACGGDGTSPIVAMRLPQGKIDSVASRLKNDRILVAARKGNLRISPHFYNDEADIARLKEALAASE